MIAARNRPGQRFDRAQPENIVERFAHQRLHDMQRFVAIETGLFVTADAGFQQRRQVIADDDARRVINGLELRIDFGHARSGRFKCRLQHRKRRSVAFRRAVRAVKRLRGQRRVGKTFQRMHARHCRAGACRSREIARRQRAAAMKYDVARFEQPAGRERLPARHDLIVGRRQHPYIGGTHVRQCADRASTSYKCHRGSARRRHRIEYVADRKRTAQRKYPRQSASGAAAADDVKDYCHPMTS